MTQITFSLDDLAICQSCVDDQTADCLYCNNTRSATTADRINNGIENGCIRITQWIGNRQIK
jgi:hypothetical protein